MPKRTGVMAESTRRGGSALPLTLLDLQSRILDVVDTAIVAVDLTGRIIFANPYARTLYGWESDELVGKMAGSLMPLAIEPPVAEAITRAIDSGASWEGTFDVRRRDGAVVTVHTIDSPLYDTEGKLAGVVSAGMDARRERDAERLAAQSDRAARVNKFLADCGTIVASTVDYEEALHALGRICTPFLGDICLIDVPEGNGIRRVMAHHHRPEMQPLVDELERRYPPDPTGPHPAVQALRTGRTEVSPEMSDDFLRSTTRDDTHFGIVKELGFQSYVCVPLVARRRILGALTLISCDPTRVFHSDDLVLAQEVAFRASLVLDNARLLTESSHVARVLQASLMPPSLPSVPGVELAARYVAFGAGAEVGGDFYDVFNAGRGAWVFALGDVCGRGPEAAVVTGSIRHSLRSAALEIRHPGKLLGVANEVLLHESNEAHLFATVLCGIMRPHSSGVRVALANAGHPPPVVVRVDGTVETPRNDDIVIGLFSDQAWSSRNLVLHHGDVLLAYTDGISEARRAGELFGEARVAEVLARVRTRPVEEIADRVIAEVRAFAGHEPSDDLALVAMRATEPH